MDTLVLATFSFVGGVVAVLVDGRKAVPIAALAVALSLAPTAAQAAGALPTMILLCTAASAGIVALFSNKLARRMRHRSGLDPDIPLVTSKSALFGPRSTRAVAAALALPAASWISFNVPVGSIADTQGLMFGTAFIWLCGAARLVLSTSLEDLAVGFVSISFAGATGVLIRGGNHLVYELLVAATLPVVLAASVGWLSGRYHLRADDAA